MGWFAAQWRRGRDVVITLYYQAFTVDPADFADASPAVVAERRHRAFLQFALVGVSVLLAGYIVFQTLVLRQTPLFMRFALYCSFGITLACLRLSFTRWAKIAYAVYFAAAYTWMLTYTHLDPSGLSVRTVLAQAYLAPLLLGISLFVSRRFATWICLGLSAVACLNVLVLPLHPHTMPPQIRYPHITSATFLLVLYLLTLALVRGWESSVHAGISALQTAYLRERALEARKDEFLHVASHELRSPLTPIILSSHLLEKRIRDGRPTEELLELTAALRFASKRMQTMAELLLDVTRIDTDRFTLDCHETDLAAIIREVAQAQGMQRRRTVRLTGTDAPIPVLLDETRLWQVLANLISNAMKYTPPDGTVDVSVSAADDAVEVAVQDPGPGIPDEARAHLFERYYQIPDGNRDEGFGLGLYICREIVEAHGGRIWEDAAPGQGACFRFTLPRGIDLTPSPAAPPQIAHR